MNNELVNGKKFTFLKKMTSNEDVLGIYGKMATLGDRKKKSKDRLKPLLDFTIEKFSLLPVRICLFYVFCQYSFATFLTFYHLLETFDPQELLKHGSFCGIQIFIQMNLWTVIFLSEEFNLFLRRYADNMIPIEMLNRKTFDKVLLAVRILKLIAAIDMALAIIASAGFIAAPEYFDERTYLCVWIEKTFPNHKKFMLEVVHWTSLPVALILAGCSVGFAYYSCTSIFQILVIHELITSISNSALPQELRRDSKLYQEAVKQKLVISIMAHECTVRFQSIASDLLEIPMMLLAVGSTILGGSLMIEFLRGQDYDIGDHFEVYIGILCFIIAGVISANTYLIIGQAIKDVSQGCYDKLCELPWYDMNRENKQIYSIFLFRSQKNLAISNSLVQIDYVLLVKIVKSLYSLAAVLTRFVSSNGEAE
ncbi:uncharacterized protein LOC123680238 [Harmonia axyridis]|uniref:uncharacterized protein LOC123680238 n=1 Tax=Harmonia axyridis TaxID=115357 RepID=UPI001E27937F|nr:uncharacterized protein LOC123680238 [Harmonia axyridis]